MPKTKISEFSATPANNTDIDSINISEGCAPSGINDAIRELMAQLKDFQTGAVGDSFNGPVGTTTAAAGAFTTLSASSTVSGTGFSTYLASPPAIGGTAAAAGSFTTLSASGNVTLSGGTANGVAYLNGSKVVTSGSALTFDGSNFFGGTNIYASGRFYAQRSSSSLNLPIAGYTDGSAGTVLSGTKGDIVAFGNAGGDGVIFANNNTEQMRLTSTGLGIGTSSPSEKLEVVGNYIKVTGTTNQVALRATNTGGDAYFGIDNSAGSNFNTGTAYAGVVWRSGANPICFVNNNSEKMRLDSSGNLGLGVTPSAWGSPFSSVMQFTKGSIACQSNSVILFNNAYYDGSNYRYVNTAGAGYYEQTGGQHIWNRAASGTAGNAITFTQAMTLDASGRLGIGNTSPTTTLSIGSSAGSGGYNGGVYLNRGSSNYNFYEASDGTNSVIFGLDNTISVAKIGSVNSYPIGFFTGNTERARIDSSGNLLVGTTSNNVVGRTQARLNVQAGSYDTVQLKGVSTSYLNIASWIPISGTTAYHIGFGDGTSSYTERGVISTNGVGTTYGTNSDYRLKENVQPMQGALAKVAALKPVTYTWKENGLQGEGFIAHELQEVCPNAVVGEKDAVKENGDPKYQNIDTSFLVATLTAAIQELKAEFDAYKASHP